jgi:hypothetical protein
VDPALDGRVELRIWMESVASVGEEYAMAAQSAVPR